MKKVQPPEAWQQGYIEGKAEAKEHIGALQRQLSEANATIDKILKRLEPLIPVIVALSASREEIKDDE